MRKIIFSLLIITLIVPIAASANGEHTLTVQEAINFILDSQQATEVDQLDCAQIDNDEFIMLGEAWMEQQHPGEEHELMDRHMGGEGSTTLRSMHINMGQAYLGCSNTAYGSAMMGMMGGGANSSMMNNDINYEASDQKYSQKPYSMHSRFMGNDIVNILSVGWWVTIILLWLLMLLSIILLIKNLTKK